MKRAGEINTGILDKLSDLIAPGITTAEIDAKVSEWLTAAGATAATLGYKGYPASCCTSRNEVICHGIPSEETLIDGDILNVDVTTILDGHYADACRMYYVGSVSQEAKTLCEVTRECLDRAIKAAIPGATLGDIGHAIQSHAEAHGYSVVRDFVGHGVGLSFHEEPQVPHYGRPGTGLVLRPGMTFTIEPMINQGKPDMRILADGWTAVTKDGGLSAQWEHTIHITDSGNEIITH